MRSGELVAGRFRVEREVGAGGMGTVFRARDEVSGVPVALKVVRAVMHHERFEREAVVLSQVNHPRVVRYMGHGATEGGERYLAMEWLEGEDLGVRLARGPLSLRETMAVARGAAQSLAALHALGIVHRDVKPSNLFLVGGLAEDTRLLDLGVARTMHLPWALTMAGVAVGTPAYMAPEQARAEGVDARADVYALGCVLHECVAGLPPFWAEHPIAALARMLVEDAPRLDEVVPGTPRALASLVSSMLARKREERPQDGGAVLARLDAAGAPDTLAVTAGPAVALTTREQRLVSVVVTRPAAGTDATQLVDERQSHEASVRQSIEGRASRLEALPNGSFVVVIEGEEAPTDLAARAAGCALAMGAVLGTDAVALATGKAPQGTRLPVGPVIDRAVALLARDAGAGVRVDPATAALLEARFEIAGEGEVRHLLGERDPLAPARRLLGKVTACVGRERELAALNAALATCVEESVATATLLTAPAGTGKSRLLVEFLRGVRSRGDVTTVMAGRCDAMSAGAPFAVLGQVLRRAAREGSDEPAVHRALLRRVERVLPGEGAVRVAEYLAEIAGAERPDGEVSERLQALRRDRVMLGDALTAAWVEWLGAETRAGAVLLVLEDLHWSDPPSMRLMDAALRLLADRPLLVVATARPEVHELFRGLWSERGVQELRLGNVSRRAAERFVRALLPELDADTTAALVERASGHPFLLEELVRAVAEGGRLDQGLPDSVAGMIHARFAVLDAAERAALRAASVFGERFSAAGVRALLGDAASEAATEQALAGLTRREFIEPHREGAGTEHAFRHALVRDAAYALLTDEDRALGHRLAGEWLEACGEGDALTIAEHFDRGAAPARAATHHARAARQALEGNDLAAALDRAQRAIERGVAGEARGELDLLRAEAQYWRGQLDDSRHGAESALGFFSPGSDRWFEALTTLFSALGQLGRNDEIARWMTVVEAATTVPTTDAQIVCLARAGTHLLYADAQIAVHLLERVDALSASTPLGTLAEGWKSRLRCEVLLSGHLSIEACDESSVAIEAFERGGAGRIACFLRISEGFLRQYLGDLERGEASLEQARREADALGAGFLSAFWQIERAFCRLCWGQIDEAEEDLVASAPRLRGNQRLATLEHLALAEIALARGRASEALEHARAGTLRPSVGLEPICHMQLVRAALAAGRLDEARAAAEHAASLPPLPKNSLWREALDLAWVDLHLAEGRLDEARAAATLGLEMVRETHRVPRNLLEKIYAGRVPANQLFARARSLGVDVERAAFHAPPAPSGTLR